MRAEMGEHESTQNEESCVIKGLVFIEMSVLWKPKESGDTLLESRAQGT